MKRSLLTKKPKISPILFKIAENALFIPRRGPFKENTGSKK